MSSISSVKNSPAIAIKISAVILNLASDIPEKINTCISLLLILTVTYERCVTIKQTVIRAGRRVYNVNLFLKKIQGT